MRRSDVRFAWSGDVAIAYEVVGDGPIDLVYLPPSVSNLDWHWEFEPHARFLERLASFSRLIVIDRRGWGLSDRVTPGSFPPLEVAADDIITVLDAVGSSRSALFAGVEAAWAAMIAAATHPDRFSALVLFQGRTTSLRTEETPWNWTEEELREAVEYWRNAGPRTFWEGWIEEGAPSLAGDAEAIDWFTKLARGTIGVGGSLAEVVQYQSTDVRAILPAIRVPTLVLYKPDNKIEAPEDGPLLASKIPGAKTRRAPGYRLPPVVRRAGCPARGGRGVPHGRSVRSQRPIGSSRPCCSPTSSTRPGRRPRSATRSGSASSRLTTSGSGPRSPAIAVVRSTRRETGSSRRSTVRPVPCGARKRSRHRSGGWGSRFERDCIRARWNSSATLLKDSPSTSGRAWPPSLVPPRCSSPQP